MDANPNPPSPHRHHSRHSHHRDPDQPPSVRASHQSNQVAPASFEGPPAQTGFSMGYMKKLPGILRLVTLVLVVLGVSLSFQSYPLKLLHTPGSNDLVFSHGKVINASELNTASLLNDYITRLKDTEIDPLILADEIAEMAKFFGEDIMGTGSNPSPSGSSSANSASAADWKDAQDAVKKNEEENKRLMAGMGQRGGGDDNNTTGSGSIRKRSVDDSYSPLLRRHRRASGASGNSKYLLVDSFSNHIAESADYGAATDYKELMYEQYRTHVGLTLLAAIFIFFFILLMLFNVQTGNRGLTRWTYGLVVGILLFLALIAGAIAASALTCTYSALPPRVLTNENTKKMTWYICGEDSLMYPIYVDNRRGRSLRVPVSRPLGWIVYYVSLVFTGIGLILAIVTVILFP